MRIHFEKNRLRIGVVIGLTLLMMGWALICLPVTHIMMYVGTVLAFMVLAFSLLAKFEIRSAWMLPLVLLAVAFAGVFLLHISINGEPLKLGAFIYNMQLSMMFALLFLAITGRIKLASGIWVSLCGVFGLVDAIIYQFRGSQIVINDVLALGTALSVANNYKLELDQQLMIGIVMLVAVMIMLVRAKMPAWPKLRKPWARLISVALAVLVAATPIAHLDRYRTYTWANRGSQGPGILYEFALELYNLKIDKPENYSPEAVQAIADEYAAAEQSEGRKPHVIAIMVEAWSDLSVLGDIQTDKEVMPWLSEFMQGTIHGQAVSSVYGGSTATSEWEFLTGNTMAFLPSGSMVYRQFVRDDIRTFVDVMENNGYSTLAMHPYFAAGWDRNRIYEMIGFDEMLFLEDADWGETVREYVTDDAFVDMLISRFEGRDEDKPMFLFGITMQNHGAYRVEDYESTIHITSPEGNMSEAEQYLSLIRLTDSALQKLITYLEGCGEDVIVLAFGDHQPQLSETLDDPLEHPTKLQKHLIPYFIWKNYEDDAREMPMTSINYLSTMLLDEAGIALPPYYQFIKQAQQTIPVITDSGLVENGEYIDLTAATAEQQQILEQYHILEYAQIFDKTVGDAVFTGVEAE